MICWLGLPFFFEAVWLSFFTFPSSAWIFLKTRIIATKITTTRHPIPTVTPITTGSDADLLWVTVPPVPTSELVFWDEGGEADGIEVATGGTGVGVASLEGVLVVEMFAATLELVVFKEGRPLMVMFD